MSSHCVKPRDAAKGLSVDLAMLTFVIQDILEPLDAVPNAGHLFPYDTVFNPKRTITTVSS